MSQDPLPSMRLTSSCSCHDAKRDVLHRVVGREDGWMVTTAPQAASCVRSACRGRPGLADAQSQSPPSDVCFTGPDVTIRSSSRGGLRVGSTAATAVGSLTRYVSAGQQAVCCGGFGEDKYLLCSRGLLCHRLYSRHIIRLYTLDSIDITLETAYRHSTEQQTSVKTWQTNSSKPAQRLSRPRPKAQTSGTP